MIPTAIQLILAFCVRFGADFPFGDFVTGFDVGFFFFFAITGGQIRFRVQPILGLSAQMCLWVQT